ncbi:MAG TPA: phosphate ABC transporter substrate-binding protein PstS [Caulobacterales bacterium]|nr:phosphate ABC transporter substrate-binding protein PstS [Caulobacterales bacterium]
MNSKITLRRFAVGAIAAVAAFASLGAVAANADEITGAGATFPQPVYTRWAEQYAAQGGDSLNYQGIGSGAGQNQIINRTVDFGASDAPVAPERLASNNLLQFPAVIGAVVVSVNLPGVDGNALKLTGPLVADMYLGRVRMWNDPRIAALNPGVSLPALPIAPVYRADSSGTTSIFTTYLGSVNLAFNTTVGAGSSVSWRAGIGAPGNAGVAGAIRNTRGAIGYVEYAYAVENNMPTPQLQNRNGQFVRPTTAAFAAAAATADWAHAPNMAASMINTAGAANWPIVSATYILLPKNPTDAGRSLKVMQFFDWAFKNGQPAADQLHYIMLPDAVRNQVRQRWCQVQAGGHAVWSGCR